MNGWGVQSVKEKSMGGKLRAVGTNCKRKIFLAEHLHWNETIIDYCSIIRFNLPWDSCYSDFKYDGYDRSREAIDVVDDDLWSEGTEI